MKTKRAFTLVEILTVIVIVSILATLVTLAVSGAMRAAKRGKIAVEMSQIAMALEQYKAEFGEYPPDMFDDDALVRHVKKRWPRLDWANMPSASSEAGSIRQAISDGYGNGVDFTHSDSQIGALALWLGGFPNVDGKLSGFYADPENPFVPSDTFDKKNVAELELGKNVQLQNFFGCTVPVIGSEVRDGFAPFVYFRGKTSGGENAYEETVQRFDFVEFGLCVPYKDTETKWKNPSTYQLIHPGLDGRYGEAGVRIIQSGVGIGPMDLDNLTNFSDYKELKSILP